MNLPNKLTVARIGMTVLFVAALLLNAMFLARALKLWRLPETDKALAKRLYKFSQSYLALLFLAMILDKIILA